jgi:hypothetical protein
MNELENSLIIWSKIILVVSKTFPAAQPKLSVYQLNGVNRHQVSRLKRGTVLVNFVGFGNRFLFLSKRGMLKCNMYVTRPRAKPGFRVTSCLGE